MTHPIVRCNRLDASFQTVFSVCHRSKSFLGLILATMAFL